MQEHAGPDGLDAAEVPRDERWLAAVYRDHGRVLFGAALRLLGRPEDAEDAVQDAFVALHRAAAVAEADVPRWLHRVVINASLDRLRRRARWRAVEIDDDAFQVPSAPSIGARLDLERAVGALPERARVVFLLHDAEGLSHDEIATLLGVTEGTSKSQLARARALLRERLAGRTGHRAGTLAGRQP